MRNISLHIDEYLKLLTKLHVENVRGDKFTKKKKLTFIQIIIKFAFEYNNFFCTLSKVN